MGIVLNGFGQECAEYLNQKDKVVNTKGIFIKVLGVVGKTADVILNTNFASLTNSIGDLQALDIAQYQMCMELQTLKNDFNIENQEARIKTTVLEMVKLMNQSGALPNDVVKQLVASGAIAPSQAQTTSATPVTATQTTPATATNANDVIFPVLPAPAPAGSWNAVTFPCQSFATSSVGVIRARGMESSMDPQIAKSIANVIALEELASKIGVTVKSTTQYFIVRTETNLNEELTKRFERKIDLSVDQVIRGYSNVCEEYRQHSTTQKYQCFVALEINEDTVLKTIHEELKQEPELQNAVPNYEKFKSAFNEVLNFYEKAGMN